MAKEFLEVRDGSRDCTSIKRCATTQIQALLANVEELTHQNEELRKTMESQNVERWQTNKNQNEEE